MGGGDSQTTNSNQSQNQNYSQLQSLIENLATQGASNQTSQATTNQTQTGATTGTTAQQQQTTNQQNTTGQTTGATTGATTGTVNPWANTLPTLNNLIASLQGMSTQLTPGQQQALKNLQAAAGGIPNVGPSAAGAINNLYNSTNGIPEAGIWAGAYGQAQNALDRYLDPNFITSNSADINQMLNGPNGVNQTIMGDVKGMFSAAGRDPTGNADASRAAATAMSQADLPIILGNENERIREQMGAEQALFGQGGATATGMTGALQTPLMNEIAAMQASGNLPGLWTQAAEGGLGAANQAYATPYQNIGTLQSLIAQLAGLGQSTAGTSMGTQTGTSAQQTAGGTTANMTGQTTGTSTQNLTGTTTGAQQGTTSSSTAGSSTGQTAGQSAGNMSGTSTTQQNPSMFNEMAGLGLGLLSLSDERLKENIEPVGLLANGLNVYKYNFRGDSRPQIGLMAQEVEQVNPDAVVDVPVGGIWGSVKMVDYGKAA